MMRLPGGVATTRRIRVAGGAMACAILLSACSKPGVRSDGLDPSTLPETVRADYALFAQRCSKCHSLARPLDANIDDDRYWVIYVDRMRNQPASGISLADVPPILRFLHYYSLDRRRATEPPFHDSGLQREGTLP
jgi:hypothetical protein